MTNTLDVGRISVCCNPHKWNLTCKFISTTLCFAYPWSLATGSTSRSAGFSIGLPIISITSPDTCDEDEQSSTKLSQCNSSMFSSVDGWLSTSCDIVTRGVVLNAAAGGVTLSQQSPEIFLPTLASCLTASILRRFWVARNSNKLHDLIDFKMCIFLYQNHYWRQCIYEQHLLCRKLNEQPISNF